MSGAKRMERAPTAPLEDYRRTVLQRYRRHVNSGLARLAELMAAPVEVRSSGCIVFDETGQRFLDCGGYGVFLLGHGHPAVIEAVRQQLERHPLSTRVLLNPQLAAAAERLAGVAPEGLDYVCFTNSGAEAVEAGIKIARLNGKRKLIAMHGGFHGKTLGALSITGRPRYQTPFQPLLPDVQFVSFGDAAPLRRALERQGTESCIVLEPVQAEGGVIIPPDGYLREVRELCSRHGAFLVLDEIQTGLGRLGTWWGADREDVVPDVLLVGKALSGGAVPVGAALATAAAYAPLNRDPLLHTSTFGGNPLATAAAEAAVNAIAREALPDRARQLGSTLLAELRAILGEACPSLVRDIRGVGLLIGIEFHSEHIAGDFMLELLHHHVVVSHSLNAHRVVRLTPPAVLGEAECAWLLGAVGEAAVTLSARYASSLTGHAPDPVHQR